MQDKNVTFAPKVENMTVKEQLKILFALLLLTVSCETHNQSGENEPKGQDSTQVQPILQKANTTVVYECNERLFAKEQAFNFIRNYLPVLQEMQVNVLWLMPIHPRGTVKSVNSPYCVKDYYAIDPAFGTMEDLRALVSDCHQHGMFVILDWVANHTAWDNQWYIEHPEWYTYPSGEETNWKDVSPLNYNKTEVQQAMQEAMIYWVREADIDGYRCDYAEGVPSSFWKTAIDAIRRQKKTAILLAEASNTTLYNAGFDWMYSWNYLGAIQKLFRTGSSLVNLYSVSSGELASTPAGKERLRYVTTHDASSETAPSTYYHTAQGELAASCLTYFLGGVPMIYSSQEIGNMTQLNFFNYNIKSFSPNNATTKAYIALMKAYVASAEARFGEVINCSSGQVAMFTRKQDTKEVLVAVNTTSVEQTITLPEQWQRVSCTDLLTDTQIAAPETLILSAYEYKVYLNTSSDRK